jgi:hypothetical protein
MKGFDIQSVLWDIEHYMRNSESGSTLVSEEGHPSDQSYKAEHAYMDSKVSISMIQSRAVPDCTNIDLIVESENDKRTHATKTNLREFIESMQLFYEEF